MTGKFISVQNHNQNSISYNFTHNAFNCSTQPQEHKPVWSLTRSGSATQRSLASSPFRSSRKRWGRLWGILTRYQSSFVFLICRIGSSYSLESFSSVCPFSFLPHFYIYLVSFVLSYLMFFNVMNWRRLLYTYLLIRRAMGSCIFILFWLLNWLSDFSPCNFLILCKTL